MSNNISESTLKLLLEMQQNEVTEHAVYLNLVKFVKKEDDKKHEKNPCGLKPGEPVEWFSAKIR